MPLSKAGCADDDPTYLRGVDREYLDRYCDYFLLGTHWNCCNDFEFHNGLGLNQGFFLPDRIFTHVFQYSNMRRVDSTRINGKISVGWGFCSFSVFVLWLWYITSTSGISELAVPFCGIASFYNVFVAEPCMLDGESRSSADLILCASCIDVQVHSAFEL